jgi:hypothetical protein
VPLICGLRFGLQLMEFLSIPSGDLLKQLLSQRLSPLPLAKGL